MRFGAFSPLQMRSAAEKIPARRQSSHRRAASARLTMLQYAGAFCIDPEQPRPIFMISKPRAADCCAAVRVR
jgi:hypothetical protein